jgi:hypothetical protein
MGGMNLRQLSFDSKTASDSTSTKTYGDDALSGPWDQCYDFVNIFAQTN